MELLSEKKITLKGKDYPIKRSVRAMIEFEKMAGKSIDDTRTLEDVLMFFFCTLKVCGFSHSYDEFIEMIDDSPEKIGEFSKLMAGGEKKRASQ